MKNAVFLFLFCLLINLSQAQSYNLTVLNNQTYQELDSTDYDIPHYSPYFGNVQTMSDMSLTAFGKAYDLNDYVYMVIKQGYCYFFNSQRSLTVYAAKGDFVRRPGDTSVFSFRTFKDSANRRFVQQWKNMGFTGGTANDYINFQLWFYESSGVIEMRFGPSSVSNGLWESGANGPTIGILEMNTNFTIIYNQLWLEGNPSSPLVVNTNNVINLNSTPVDGTVYRFVPGWPQSVHEKASNSFSIYPNPAMEEITLDYPASFEWMLFDLNGKVLMQDKADKHCTINSSALPAGIYYVQLKTNAGMITRKLSVTHN